MEEDQCLARLAALGVQSRSLSFLTEKDLILSLVSAKKPSYRLRILKLLTLHAFSNPNLGQLLHSVFLAFTRDPYPYVRKSALLGMVYLIRAQYPQSSCFYDRAVELLPDSDSVVRSAAVQVIGEYGQKLSSSGDGKNQLKQDEVFIRLCSMGRDMNVEVRIEAFRSLGRIQLVSEDILLQTLSKKVLGSRSERKFLAQCSQSENLSLVSSAAGAFIHGLEDEFYEVRSAACASLGKLTIFSTKFATEALKFLVDMLSDDTMVIRLQTFETLFFMASCGSIQLQELHMHMLLSGLMDTYSDIRSAARKLLRVIKLPDLEIFKSAITGLLNSLEMYAQDGAEIFSALFFMGKNHEKFAAIIVKEFAVKMEPSSKEEFVLDKAQVTILLVLGLTTQIAYDQIESCIPTKAFSYPLLLLGNMPLSIRDIMKPNSILINHDSSISFLNKVVNCKQTIARMTVASDECYDVLAFASKYIKVIKLLTRVWEYVEPRKSQLTGGTLVDLLLEKLERNLLNLKYSLFGLSKEEDYHIVELILLSCVLRLSKTSTVSALILKRTVTTMSHVAFLSEEGDSRPSTFVKELRKALSEVSDHKICYPFPACKLIELYSLEQIVLSGRFKLKQAELYVPKNDLEKPLPFLSGFPVGINFRIILHNVYGKDRLWVQMRVEQVVEHVFVDLNLFEGSVDVKECTIDLPFYRTPKTASFSLWVCVGLECSHENAILHTGGRDGPRKELTFLCKELEISFVSVRYKN
ncbi:protein SIEL isoform X2 [Aristolochia californica]|uniref:protein SIEL isoform X2 n=1 Tax=Aristolochia californica TaxID=171875 RepID=UPI0035E106B4